MIDFDSPTSDSLRYCSNIVAWVQLTFTFHRHLLKTLLMNEREKLAYTEAMAGKQEKQTFAKILPRCGYRAIKFFCQCAVTINKGISS